MSRSFYLGSDHGALDLKNQLVSYIQTSYPNFEVLDLGTHSTESVDYPDIAGALSEKVLSSNGIGILCCGTGIGMSLKANRYKGIRAALVYDTHTATLCKEHNNANVLVLGSRVTNKKNALKITKIFFKTKFLKGRHLRRVKKFKNV